MSSEENSTQVIEAQKRIRTLLALWDLGGVETDVKKSELTKRIQRTNEKSRDYQDVFEKLEKEGVIATATKSRSVRISLTNKGINVLNTGLKSPNFQFGGRQIRAKDVDALLKWIRHLDSSIGVPATQDKSAASEVASYEAFKQVAMEAYDQLNWNYNLDDLVPIYRIRREIGERVSRAEFNEWLLEMQANEIFQLQGGSIEDSASDKIEDSITTELDGLRCYAKRLKP